MGRKEFSLVVLISTISYLLFFYKSFSPNHILYSGKDSVALHYQTRYYLQENLERGVIPFWTERMLLGYPIYADLERGVLNFPNLLLIYVLGAETSYKILHFVFYILGSVSLYLLIRKSNPCYPAFVASNSVFFFSFFLLFHQQHFNIVLTAYALPAFVYFFPRVLGSEKKFFKHATAFALLVSTVFYFGSFQMLLMNLIITGAYALFISGLRFSKKLAARLVFLALLLLVFIMPGFVAQQGLYRRSLRVGTDIAGTGSVSPAMLVNTVYPFLFERGESYMGINVDRNYLMHEVYIYIGLVGVCVYLLGFLSTVRGREKNFHAFLVATSILLMIWGAVPLLNKIEVFPFSAFRYWVRAVYLLIFSVSLGVGMYLGDSRADFRVKLSGGFLFKLLIFTISTIVLSIISDFEETTTIAKLLISAVTAFRVENILWSALLFTTLFILFGAETRKFRKAHLLAFLIVADILTFGFFASGNLYLKRLDVLSYNRDRTVRNERVFDYSGKVNSDTSLSSGYWNVLGYAELTPVETAKNLQELGLLNRRYAVFENEDYLNESQSGLKELGVSVFINEYGSTSASEPVFLKGVGLKQASYGEGFFFGRRDPQVNESVIEVKTKINYYPGWKVFVDGIEVTERTAVSDRGFIETYMELGESAIKFRFVPVHLYYGLTVSGFLFLVCCTYAYGFRKKLA